MPTPGKNAKRVVFGAVRHGYDRFIGLTCPRKNGTAFRELLTRIALRARRIRKKIFLVTDNARFHKTKKGEALIKELSPWVKVVWLPKYSANLNAIEVFWKHMKRTCFGNTLYRSAEEFERHVDDVVARLCRDPEAVLAPTAEMRIAS